MYLMRAGTVLVLALAVARPAASGAEPPDEHAAVFAVAAVAADHPVASEAGAEMLRRGGNAVDAAVATSFCLSVVRPESCGLGGGGFMLIHMPARDGLPARSIALDYRERCPEAVGPDYYEHDPQTRSSLVGVHAVGVPGTVAGLLLALERYGTLDRTTVLAPAIRAASEGFAADATHVRAIAGLRARLDAAPGHRDRADDLLRLLAVESPGDIVRNPDQAAALRLIAEQGADAFYRGPIAEAIDEVMGAGGGPVRRGDLDAYSVRVLTPLHGRFAGYDILAMPPPSSGGVALLQILGLAERLGVTDPARRFDSAETLHILAEACKHAFADRAEWLADPDFAVVPVDRLISSDYLDERAELFDARSTHPPEAYGSRAPPVDDDGTSHLSVIDAQGMAVACTETINTGFGSTVVVPGFGFALNNEMDDFTTVRGKANTYGLRQSDRNLPHPGQRPLSSMTPTIVLRRGSVVAVAGASGGPRIITGTAQTLLRCLIFDNAAGDAVAAPRLHHQWIPDVLGLEAPLFDPERAEELRVRGHEVERTGGVGNVQLVLVRAGSVEAACDPRKGGRPAGM